MAQPQPQNHPNLLVGQLKISADDTTQFGYVSTGTVKKFIPGTRYRIGDRVFHYGKATAALKGGYGAFNQGAYTGVTGGNVTARAIGDMWLDILLDATTGGTTWFGTKNNMVGGIWCQPDATNPQFRMITGHEKGASAATIKVYLDAPITRTMIATSFMEIAQNPYNQLQHVSGGWASVMGVPATVIASGSYGWTQSWGPCWLTPGLPVADTVNWREVVFVGDGSIRSVKDAYDADNNVGYQRAGFVIDKTSGDNPPFVFLQICP